MPLKFLESPNLPPLPPPPPHFCTKIPVCVRMLTGMDKIIIHCICQPKLKSCFKCLRLKLYVLCVGKAWLIPPLTTNWDRFLNVRLYSHIFRDFARQKYRGQVLHVGFAGCSPLSQRIPACIFYGMVFYRGSVFITVS